MGEAVSFLTEPGHSLQALASGERDLKIEYIRVRLPRRATPSKGLSRAQMGELVTQSVRTLELNLALAGFAEAVHELRLEDTEAVLVRIEDVCRLARTTIGQDPRLVAAAWMPQVPPPMQEAATSVNPLEWDAILATMVSTAKSLVSAIPIEELVAMATLVARPEDGHRCRLAFDGLRAFVRRTDPSVQASTKAAGRAYSQGRLSVAEVALLLDLSPADAIALLEEHGFNRSLETIALSSEERSARLRKLRSERLARAGPPPLDPALVRRDVLSTQRIEGIDARPWVDEGQ